MTFFLSELQDALEIKNERTRINMCGNVIIIIYNIIILSCFLAPGVSDLHRAL